MATGVTTGTVVSYTAFPPLRISEAVTRKQVSSLRGIRRMPGAEYANKHASMSSSHSTPVARLIANAVYLCCTVSGVASARRYLASCPVKPGLSSPVPFRLHSSDHPSCSWKSIVPLI